jgi:hypothetical protein
MRTPNPLVATLLLLLGTAACAGAEMNRGASAGDDVGEDDAGTTASQDDGPATTEPGTTGADAESTTDDPTAGVDGDSGATDPAESSDGTDPTAAESSSSDGTSGDPTDTDPSTSTTDPGTTTDATDTQGVEIVDMSGYTIVQTDSAREFVIPDNTLVNVGTVIVVGRNASSAAFQDFWGQSWGDEVVYFEGLDAFPTINGAETYALLDPGQNLVDGPTPALELATVLARSDASAPGGDDGAWELGLAPNVDSTPGVAAATGGTAGVPYVSEYSDPTGSGNFDYEFVEIHVPG